MLRQDQLNRGGATNSNSSNNPSVGNVTTLVAMHNGLHIKTEQFSIDSEFLRVIQRLLTKWHMEGSP